MSQLQRYGRTVFPRFVSRKILYQMLSARFNFESELKHLHIGCYHALNTASHDNFLIMLTVKTSFMKRQENKLRGI